MIIELPKKLPAKFKTLFWDTNYKTIDPSSKALILQA